MTLHQRRVLVFPAGDEDSKVNRQICNQNRSLPPNFMCYAIKYGFKADKLVRITRVEVKSSQKFQILKRTHQYRPSWILVTMSGVWFLMRLHFFIFLKGFDIAKAATRHLKVTKFVKIPLSRKYSIEYCRF